ncbi:MAG: BamA/TamA family outer membrane protein, partial [Candidatus Omnitrophica bacterium]|nr:BamA/TamA family outer membrane protein [Candidatus Omnitrophota bacterium]
YSTVDQFVGFAEVEQKNFDWKNFPYFTGAGQDLKFRASFGSVSSGYDLSFTEPWMFDYPIAAGFDAYQNEHSKDTDVGYGYDEKTTGGDLRFGKELSEFIRADIAYRYDKVKISNVDDNATNDLKQEVGTNVTSSITPVFTFDSRDNVFDTTKGNLVTGSFQWAGGGLGGDKDFWKFFGRASQYFPMFRNSVLEIRGRVGLAQPYSSTDRVPIFERFFTGGASTIRGYDERKVGPVDPVSKDPLGGASMLVGNIEYTYPLFSFLKVAAFYDVGNTWEKLSDIGSSRDAFGVSSSGGFKSGIGLGVRVKTPIGPLMLDYGIPLNKEPGEDNRKSGKFHFSFSRGF